MLNESRLILLTALVSLGTAAADDNKDMDVKSTGYFIVDGGFISETEDVGLKKWNNESYGDFIGGLRLSAQPSERFHLTINPELKSHSMFPISPGISTGIFSPRISRKESG